MARRNRNRKPTTPMDQIAARSAKAKSPADDAPSEVNESAATEIANAKQADGADHNQQPTDGQGNQQDPTDEENNDDDRAQADVLTLEVPIDPEFPPSEFCVHIDTRLDSRQSTTLRRIASQLDRSQATLANGQRITHPTHAVKYLLEKLSGIPLRP